MNEEKTQKIAYTQHYGESHCGTCGEAIDNNHGKFVSCNLEWRSLLKNKEEAIEFAKEYLEIRLPQFVRNSLSEKIKDVAIEYVVLDIIPHLYGEALD